MKLINVLQAHFYPQKNIILPKQLTKFATIASVALLFYEKVA